jgi:hypothetical protein
MRIHLARDLGSSSREWNRQSGLSSLARRFHSVDQRRRTRFLNLQLYVDDGSPDSITLNSDLTPTNTKGPHFLQIGTEGGFLPRPVWAQSNMPFDRKSLASSLSSRTLHQTMELPLTVRSEAFAGMATERI